MDVFDKFFSKFAYKFDKGYPDLNNKQDILLLESLFERLGIEFIFENQELVQVINNSKLFTDYGDLDISGKDTLKLTFSDIPNRGAESTNKRLEVYDLIQKLVDQEEDLTDFRKKATGSSLGSVTINFKGKDYTLVVKGASDETQSDTDVKEALVSLFYASNIDSPFSIDNYLDRVNGLISQVEANGIPGESKSSSQKVVIFLTAINETNSTKNVKFLNQPLSSALAIKEAYPKSRLIRDGIFNSIRTKAQSLTGLPADKWNPGDLYVQLGEVGNFENADNIEIINDFFNDEWGGKDKPLTAVSLKQAEAQGGKAKALLDRFAKAKDDYNLSKEEIEFDKNQFKNGIKNLRAKVQKMIDTNPEIEYIYDGSELKDDIRFLRGKYAALKSIEFLFREFPSDNVDEAIVALVGFALSLSGINPTFFKVTGQTSGAPGRVDKFPRGQNVALFNEDGVYEPIQIKDTENFGGLKIDFIIEKGGKPYTVSISARNNGNTQGTLEVQKIQPLK